MKVIISHDVDHLYSTDHIFKDLILEKMFVRSLIQFFAGKIRFKTLIYRITMVLHKNMQHIEEVMQFDKEHNIPSTFFFGVKNVLGMSYSLDNAKKFAKLVHDNGFDVGVHGCDYSDLNSIKNEHDIFKNFAINDRFGVRNHYVRFNEDTFKYMSEVGYLFDTTYFNKKETELINPYKVGNMWEFPLHIMDGFVLTQGRLEEGLKQTFDIIDKASNKGISYLTILFHDYQFNETFDPDSYEWYIKTIEYCEKKGIEFVSYKEAIKELDNAD